MLGAIMGVYMREEEQARLEPRVSKQTVRVANRLGLHARPAADFVTLANTFHADIRVRKGRRTVNGKSIMGILTLAAAARSRVIIEAHGPEAADAVKALAALLQAGEPS